MERLDAFKESSFYSYLTSVMYDNVIDVVYPKKPC